MVSTSLPGRMRVSLRPNVVFTHLDVPATSQSSRVRAARHRQDSEPTQRPSQRPMPWLVEVGGVLEGRNLMVVAGRSDGGVGTQERGTGRLGWTP
jgi:hypothetical protein